MISRKKLPLVSMAGVIASGLIICILALYFVSQQKNVRTIDTRRELTARLSRLRDSVEARVREYIDRAVRQTRDAAGSRPGFFHDPGRIREHTKTLVLNHPIILYPFIIDSKQRFVFPVSRKAALPKESSIELDTGLMPPGVKTEFLNAYRLEFTDKQFHEAIQGYGRVLRHNPPAAVRPFVLNALARCYRKLNRHAQAIHYYRETLKTMEGQASHRLFYFTILRQTALTYNRMNSVSLAARFYLRLYDELQQDETSGASLEYYKNEALAYLNRHARSKSKKTPVEKPGKPGEDVTGAMARLSRSSELEISLQWLYFEVDQDAARPTGGNKDEGAFKFIKLRDLYEVNDRKTRFYQSVRHSVKLDTVSSLTPAVYPIRLVPAPGSRTGGDRGSSQTVDVALSLLLKDQPGHGNIYTGFMISPDFVRDRIINIEAESQLQDPALTAGFFKPGSRPLITLPFESLFPDRSLALYASTDNYIDTLVRGEIRLYYGLLFVLIVVLVFGIFLFYKYITREAQLVRMKSQFVDSASHTLKTPLTRISLLAENMAGGWITDKNRREEYLKGIISETARMGEMIDNLLDFSRIEEGRRQYKPGKVYLQEIIGELLDQYSTQFKSRGFDVKTQIDDTLPALKLDPRAARLIAGNLIQNAVKYSLEDKKISISLYGKDNRVVFEVSDNGIGIAAKDIPLIFKEFSRAADSRIASIEGSGLGLFLVHHAVEAHGGKIEVTSTLNEGTTFKVRLVKES